MHRVVAAIVISVAVAVAVGFRVWTADESDAPETPTVSMENVVQEPIAVSAPEDLSAERSNTDAPTPHAQPAATTDTSVTPHGQGRAVDQEPRRPVTGRRSSVPVRELERRPVTPDMTSIDNVDSNNAVLSNTSQRSEENVDGKITDTDSPPPVGVDVSGSIAALGLGENAMVRLRAPDGISFGDLVFTDSLATGMDMISASGGFGDVAPDGSFNVDNVEPGEYVIEVYQQPDPSTVDLSGDIDLETIQALMPILVYSQEISVGDEPIQVTIAAPIP